MPGPGVRSSTTSSSAIARRAGWHFIPFDRVADYRAFIDGRRRLDAIHVFLGSRGIRLPEGRAQDPVGADTAYGLARRKGEMIERELLRRRVSAVRRGPSLSRGHWSCRARAGGDLGESEHVGDAGTLGAHEPRGSADRRRRHPRGRAALTAVPGPGPGCVPAVSASPRTRPFPSRTAPSASPRTQVRALRDRSRRRSPSRALCPLWRKAERRLSGRIARPPPQNAPEGRRPTSRTSG